MSAAAVSRLRGVTAGLFTGALALTAHGFADHMAPTGGAVALLAVVSCAFGAAVARWPRSSQLGVLVAVLAAGQLVGHLALSAGGAMPGAHTSPVMLTAHSAAVITAAVLVTACERLFTVLSSTIRRCTSLSAVPAVPGTAGITVRNDPPTQRVRLLAASISHRGPPVGALR